MKTYYKDTDGRLQWMQGSYTAEELGVDEVLTTEDENTLPTLKEGQKLAFQKGELVAVSKSEEELQQEREAIKEQEIKTIDQHTEELIAQGFEFDGHTFSLSEHAQLNWTGLMTLLVAGKFGESQEITTKDDRSYNLIKEKASQFFDTATQKLTTEIAKGRTEKQKVLSQ